LTDIASQRNAQGIGGRLSEPAFIRSFTRAGVLRSMSAASTSDQQRFAANGFRLWAEAEDLLLGEK
jgi:hypothetical protein